MTPLEILQCPNRRKPWVGTNGQQIGYRVLLSFEEMDEIVRVLGMDHIAGAGKMVWQPISTAPMGEHGKPDTYILISKQEQGTTLVATGYRNEYGTYEWWGGGMTNATHWMPLPKPPSTPDRRGP